MKLAVAASLVALAIAASQQVCFPDSCRLDSNCRDTIHFRTAKCCGGTCVSSIPQGKVVGETCNRASLADGIVNFYESCGGLCAQGLYCGPEGRCNAMKPAGCNCSEADECLSGNCAFSNMPTNYSVCRARNGAFGETCVESSDCASNLCVNGKCDGLAVGAQCNVGFGAIGCANPSTVSCKRANSSDFNNYCLPRCAVTDDSCYCQNANNDCIGGSVAARCNATRCSLRAALGEGCDTFANTCADPTAVCATVCNVSSPNPCQGGPIVCQTSFSLKLGDLCLPSFPNYLLCPQNSSCVLDSGSTNYTCKAYYTVAPGDPCTSANQCAPPSDICRFNTSGYQVCRSSGQVAVGGLCYPGTPSDCATGLCENNGTDFICPGLKKPGDICTLGSQCPGGASQNCQPYPGASSSLCITSGYNCTCVEPGLVAPGGYCTTSSNTNLTCASGLFDCLNSNGNTGGCNSRYYGCTCVARTIETGQPCNYTLQCKDPYAACPSTNKTCQIPTGFPCDSPDDCGDTSIYDCGCNRKCYVWNPPTPIPATLAPTPPTPGRCDDKLSAWNAAKPLTFPTFNGYLSYSNFDCNEPTGCSSFNFVRAAQNLTDAQKTALIDLTCCYTCPGTASNRFSVRIVSGYQLDCAKKTLTQLQLDPCNSKKSDFAVLNCWAPAYVGSATTAGFGFGIVVAAVFALLL